MFDDNKILNKILIIYKKIKYVPVIKNYFMLNFLIEKF